MPRPQASTSAAAVAAVAAALAVSWALHARWRRRESVSPPPAPPSAPPREDAGRDALAAARSRAAAAEKRVAKLARANRKLGTHHERLHGLRAKLFVPALPPTAEDTAATVDAAAGNEGDAAARRRRREHYVKVIDHIAAREAQLERQSRRGFKRDHIDLPTLFPHETAASAEEKVSINEEIARRLSSCVPPDFDGSLADYLQARPDVILVALDTPALGTTKTILKAFPRCPQRSIQIPQADVMHYFSMISGMRETGLYLGVRCQRLDHWMCANRDAGLHTLLLYADFESTFVGNGGKRLSPALDVQRWFRLGYPAAPKCMLVLTVKMRPPFQDVQVVNDYVTQEGALNGYRVRPQRVWATSMTTILYSVESTRAPRLNLES